MVRAWFFRAKYTDLVASCRDENPVGLVLENKK